MGKAAKDEVDHLRALSAEITPRERTPVPIAEEAE